MTVRLAAAAAAILSAVCGSAVAQQYPVKPIRVINPFSPGGSLDLVARSIAKHMSTELGQTVVVENRPGAGGNIGIEAAAKAPADGYTLLAVQTSLAINPVLQKSVPFDPVKDFDPISKTSSYMFFLVVHPSVQARTVKELIALAKARPDQLTYASVGIGSGTHLSGELFKYMTGVKITHVPYKGSGPSIIDLVGGHVAMQFGSTSVLPHVKTGKLALLAVTGAKRSSFVPQTPTLAESGLPGYEVTAWNAMFAPAGTPAPIINRLNGLVHKALAHPESKAVMEAQGLEADTSTPAALGQLVKSELVKWAKLIKVAGIKPE
ncbi:MAG TPA: tripartite tricarboxylate transporter substrate binding protein [Burkholderiales bacterium]|nr:tripartite tricarboxylate transporter substrate binding protein [Burkholderiales bacterium]